MTASIPARVFHALGLSGRVPKPSGPHLVRSVHFRVPGENGVMTQVFFPVSLVERESGDPDVQERKRENVAQSKRKAYRKGALNGFAYFSMTPRWLFDLFLGAAPHPLADVPAHAQPVLHETGHHSMPLVIFSHGLGGNCEVNTKCCSDMASHGYIVVAMEHEDGSGSYAKTTTGEVIKYARPPNMPYVRENVIGFRGPHLLKREKEIRAAVNFFTETKDYDEYAENKDILHCLQAVNSDKVFLAGHSFGGATTVHTIRAWPGRFRGAILMDLWPFPIPNLQDGIKDVPVCLILSEEFDRSQESYLTSKLLRNSNNVLCQFWAAGTVHSSFSDSPFWGPAWIAKRFNLRGSVDPEEAQKCFNDVYVTFMDEILAGKSGSLTAIVDPSQPASGSLQQRLLAAHPILRPFVKSKL